MVFPVAASLLLHAPRHKVDKILRLCKIQLEHQKTESVRTIACQGRTYTGWGGGGGGGEGEFIRERVLEGCVTQGALPTSTID